MSCARALLSVGCVRQSLAIRSGASPAKRSALSQPPWIEGRPRSNRRARDWYLSSSSWPKRAHAWRSLSESTRSDERIVLRQPCGYVTPLCLTLHRIGQRGSAIGVVETVARSSRPSLVTMEEKVKAIAEIYVKRTHGQGCAGAAVRAPTAICRRTCRACSRTGGRASRTRWTPKTRTRSRSVTSTA
jgi:hypothetical protein